MWQSRIDNSSKWLATGIVKKRFMRWLDRALVRVDLNFQGSASDRINWEKTKQKKSSSLMSKVLKFTCDSDGKNFRGRDCVVLWKNVFQVRNKMIRKLSYKDGEFFKKLCCKKWKPWSAKDYYLVCPELKFLFPINIQEFSVVKPFLLEEKTALP